MYPPFHIRNLHQHRGGTVHLEPSDYDDFSQTAEARLTYLDEDDGEIITVGSAYELGERLREPAPASRYTFKGEDLKENPMHIFDIDPSETIRAAWAGFEIRTSPLDNPIISQEVFPSPDETSLEQLENNARRYLARDPYPYLNPTLNQSPRDFSYQWLQPSDSPQIPPSISNEHKTHPSERSGKSAASQYLTAERERQGRRRPHRIYPPFHRLTPDQAREILITRMQASASGSKDKENRWASYKTQSSQKDSQPPTQDNLSKPIAEPEKPFLELLEEELARSFPSNQSHEDPANDTTLSTNKAEEHKERSVETPSRSSPDQIPLQKAGELVLQAVQALSTGVGLLGAEITRSVPEIEGQLSNLQQTLPGRVDKVVSKALESINGHAEEVSRGLQSAAETSRNAAERTRTDLQIVDEVVKDVSGLIFEVGKTIWGSFQEEMVGGRENAASMPTNNPPAQAPVPPVLAPPEAPALAPQAPTLQIPAPAPVPAPAPPAHEPIAPRLCAKNCLIGGLRQHERCVPPYPSLYNQNMTPRADQIPAAVFGINDAAGNSIGARGMPYTMRGSDPVRLRMPARFTYEGRTFSNANTMMEYHKSIKARRASLQGQDVQPKAPSFGMPEFTYEYCAYPDGDSMFRWHELLTSARSVRAAADFKEAEGQRQGAVKGEGQQSSNRLHHMQSTPALGGVRPILDEEDADEGFSARYPSLISSSAVHRSNTIGNTLSNSGFLRTMNPESEIARFPTISQLERASLPKDGPERSQRHSLPVLHSNGSESALLRQVPGAWPENTSESKPAASTASQKHKEESSGAFFERMTGRRAAALDDSILENRDGPNPAMVRRAHTTAGMTKHTSLVSSDPAARLPGPFDPLKDLSNVVRPGKERHGRHLRQRKGNAVHSGPIDSSNPPDAGPSGVPSAGAPNADAPNAGASNAGAPIMDNSQTLWSQSSFQPGNHSANFDDRRRPYSTHFTGAGRTGPLNTFIESDGHGQNRQDRGPRPAQSVPDFNSRALPAFPHLPTISSPLPPVLTLQIPRSRRGERPPVATSQQRRPQHRVTKQDKVRDCMDRLGAMGYPGDTCRHLSHPRGARCDKYSPSTSHIRELVAAAEGDIGIAIDMIEEEREAWNEMHKA